MREKARIIELQKHLDPRGNLSVVEESGDIPFKIARTYWIYDVPGGEFRGSHAFRKNDEFIIALSGSFDVVLDSGDGPEVYSLNRSYYGLYVPRMTWRELRNFSTNSLALVLASEPFDEADYVRNPEEFRELLLKFNG